VKLNPDQQIDDEDRCLKLWILLDHAAFKTMTNDEIDRFGKWASGCPWRDPEQALAIWKLCRNATYPMN
jgi:hypothetical protein